MARTHHVPDEDRASPQLGLSPFAKALRRWIAQYQMHHPDDADRPRYALAHDLDINVSSWSRYRNGHAIPSLEQCRAIAHRLDIPVEAVIREAHYPDLAGLVQVVREHPDRDDQHYIITLLTVAQQSSEWKKAAWHASVWKERAEEDLTRSDLSLYARARHYADDVWGWYYDPQRNIDRANRRTDEILVIAS